MGNSLSGGGYFREQLKRRSQKSICLHTAMYREGNISGRHKGAVGIKWAGASIGRYHSIQMRRRENGL